jgi:hypothetical protein
MLPLKLSLNFQSIDEFIYDDPNEPYRPYQTEKVLSVVVQEAITNSKPLLECTLRIDVIT